MSRPVDRRSATSFGRWRALWCGGLHLSEDLRRDAIADHRAVFDGKERTFCAKDLGVVQINQIAPPQVDLRFVGKGSSNRVQQLGCRHPRVLRVLEKLVVDCPGNAGGDPVGELNVGAEDAVDVHRWFDDVNASSAALASAMRFSSHARSGSTSPRTRSSPRPRPVASWAALRIGVTTSIRPPRASTCWRVAPSRRVLPAPAARSTRHGRTRHGRALPPRVRGLPCASERGLVPSCDRRPT